MTETISHATLKDKQRSLRGGFPTTMGLRVHRSISWVGRAEKETKDDDARFIFLWIAFNAAYASERELQDSTRSFGERDEFMRYFRQMVGLDHDRRIYRAIWERFSGPVHMLMKNKYVFRPFWQHHNDMGGFDDWEQHLQKSAKVFHFALKNGDTTRVLSHVFDRLYVLRNQIVHGGSTWNSDVNRDQVRDGAAILGFLMPVFIDIMMDNPMANWGQPFYPVID